MDGNGSQSPAENNPQLADAIADFDGDGGGTSSETNSAEFCGDATAGEEEEGEQDGGHSSESHPADASDDEDDGELSSMEAPIEADDCADASNCSEDDEELNNDGSVCGDESSHVGERRGASIDDNVIDLDNNELNYDEEEEGGEGDSNDGNNSPKLVHHQASLDCGGAEQISDSDDDGVEVGLLPVEQKRQKAEELQGEAISSEGEEEMGDGDEHG
uniref:Acidic repeat-containing protein-like n=1 Tax=Globodera pallida TaxID=36090 RepID=A0A183C2S3_GLOPA